MSPVCALSIASSDSGGGAGIQADLKAFARCGVHGATAVAAITAQNTHEVTAIHACPPDIVVAQIAAIMADLAPSAAKTGLLFNAAIIQAVAHYLQQHPIHLVIDPVMISSTGVQLLEDDAVVVLKSSLFPLAAVVTPNLLEAQVLTGIDSEDRAELAEALVGLGPTAAIVTGGHGAEPVDHLFTGTEHIAIPVIRYPIVSTHGAGCTHSAALAAFLAKGEPLETAARKAAKVANEAVKRGLVGLGSGDGPVNALDIRQMQEVTLP